LLVIGKCDIFTSRKTTAPVPETIQAILRRKPIYIASVSRKSPTADGRLEDEGVEYHRHYHSVLLNDFMDTFAIETANVGSVHFAATELSNSLPLNDTIMPAVLMRDRLQWKRPILSMSHVQESFLHFINAIPIKSILNLVIQSAEGLPAL
jgi:hypothetical protein